jgi:hypothetical protein
MKKATNFTFYLALWIVLLFCTGMFMTFVNDALQASGFFGDKPFVYSPEYKYMLGDGCIDTTWTWGARHYWYHLMCVCLFILSIVRIVIWSNWYWSDKNK